MAIFGPRLGDGSFSFETLCSQSIGRLAARRITHWIPLLTGCATMVASNAERRMEYRKPCGYV